MERERKDKKIEGKKNVISYSGGGEKLEKGKKKKASSVHTTRFVLRPGSLREFI